MYPFFNQRPKPHFVPDPGGKLRLATVPVRPSGERMKAFYANSLLVPFKEWLGWNSYAINLVNEFYYGLRQRSRANVAPVRDIYAPESIDLFNRIAALLDARIRAAGARGIIVYSAKAVSALRHVAESHMEALDLYPVFLQAGAGDDARCYFADGYH